MTLLDGDAHHAAPARFDNVAADDGVFGPVGAFDKGVWLNRGDQIARRVLVKNDDAVNTRERLEDFDPLRCRRDRTAWSLVGAHGSVGVDAYDQRITEPACALQVADVAGVQQIEHAIGEDDRFASGPKALN